MNFYERCDLTEKVYRTQVFIKHNLGNFGNCTSSHSCGEDEGDCDYDSQCKEGHICGVDNCRDLLGFHSQFDCCYSLEEDFCTVENLCDVYQGDCDSDADCLNGLVCGLNNCPNGYDPEVDCCYQPIVGDNDFCALGIPCAVNEGDCDSDEECEIELFCGSNNCPDSIELDLEVDCCFALTSNTIISPNYPKPYPSNVIETWQLNADIGFKINLQFLSFQVGIKSMLLNIISLRRLMFPLFYFIIHRLKQMMIF